MDDLDFRPVVVAALMVGFLVGAVVFAIAWWVMK